MFAVEFNDVRFVYGEGTPFRKEALKGATFSINSGSMTGIIGHTGSGKSTVAQLMNGLLTKSGGEIRLFGEDIPTDAKALHALRFRIGLVFQYPEYQLFEETVFRDIAFGPKNMGLSEDEIKARVEKAADFVGLDRSLLSVSPFDLSGGQKRRAAIAGVIAMSPEILILDEPAAGLDPRGRDEILGRITDYRRETGSTVVIISHSLEDMARYCSDIVVMSDGRAIIQGGAERVFMNYDLLLTAGLDVPPVSKLSMLLEQRGDIPDSVPPSERAVFTAENAEKLMLKILESDK
ncbi:MAG: energy-coupling factor transporter ATPase [Clostridia bacterium]|nr:energy-coupling factor transporter ATPase [Clostridia bacterium]